VLVGGRYVEPAEHRTLSPAVRRLVAEHDLDVRAISGSGRGGRITFRDVEAYLSAHPDPTPRPRTRDGASGDSDDAGFVQSAVGKAAVALHPGISATPTGRDPDGAPDPPTRSMYAAPPSGSTERVSHTPMRKGIAEHMVRSLLHTAPHVTAIMEVDLTRVLAHQRQHRPTVESRGHRLTLTAYFVRAAVKALRAVPEANARWQDDALELVGDCNVGIATAVRGGLLVPVIRNAETLDLAGVAAKLTDMTARTREGKVRLDEVQNGTFTITNHGASGSLIATPIINQPQSAILGIGKVEKRVVVREVEGADTLQIRPLAYVTLTIDHRVLDGFQANMFLGTFVEVLEGWGR
jgi:2-oxoglutarate dehydrogenase E2 component (dihydrolipoamide succinyltransferase)